MEIKEEVWKPVIHYQGLYQVSNLGSVRSIWDSRHNKSHCRLLKHKIKRTKFTVKQGYYCLHQVALSKDNKKTYPIVSRLVWEAFNGPIKKGLHVDHINNNPADNRLSNLQLLTPYDNRHKILKDNPQLSRTFWMQDKRKKVLCIQTDTIYPSIRKAARETHVDNGDICRCCKGQNQIAGKLHWKYAE